MLSNHTGDKIHSDITEHEITEYVIARVTECVIAKVREHIIAKVTEYEIEQDLRLRNHGGDDKNVIPEVIKSGI